MSPEQRQSQQFLLSRDAVSSQRDFVILRKRFVGASSGRAGAGAADAFARMRSAQQLLRDIAAGRGEGGPLLRAL